MVARGFEQRSGIDYNKTFAPIMQWSTLRTIIALAATFGWKISYLDLVTVFFNGTLKEIIYMAQPQGFKALGQEDLICMLNRSLYALK